MRSHSDPPTQIEILQSGEPSNASERIQSVFDLTAADVEKLKRKRPKLLGIVCGRSDCKRDLHCFRPKKLESANSPGRCQECGVELVNWDQMHARDLLSAPEKFELLRKEWIRHFFFHVPLTDRIKAYARKHGVNGLVAVARKQLSKGTMLRFNESLDFNQTAMLDGTIVHWARHAVACCCRRCMAYWHDVPLTAELSATDIDYFEQLLSLYIKERIPDLESDGQPA